MVANVVQQQWFVVRGWLDNSEWGDEPPDPDDVWSVGDRVRLKGTTVEGTVQLTREHLFLDAYLPLVLVLWDGKSIPVPIEPELLVRLTRFIPPGLTWKAPESFSDKPRLKPKSNSLGNSTQLTVNNQHPTISSSRGKKVCDRASVHRQLANRAAKPSSKREILTNGCQNTNDVPNVHCKRPPSNEVQEDKHLYSLEKIQETAPFSSSNSIFKSQLLPSKQPSTSTVSDESYVELETDNRSTTNHASLPSLQIDCPSVDDAPTAVLRDEKPFSLEKTQQPPESIIYVTSNSSGSLYRYLKNVQLKSGEIASYPRVVERDPDNLNHWYWGYNYKVKEDGSWKSKSLSLPRNKVRMVQRMIEKDAPVDEIRASLKVLRDESDSFLEKEDSTDVYPDSEKVLGDEPVNFLEKEDSTDVYPDSEKVLRDEPFSFLEKEYHATEPTCLEKVLRDDLSFSLERPQASGSLCSYLKKKKLKSGTVASYPRVEGDRDPNNPDHWYWSYCYEVLVDGEWKGRTLSIPKCKIVTVRAMIDSQKPVSAIKAFLSKEKTIKDKGS